jgi:hypothetical protein
VTGGPEGGGIKRRGWLHRRHHRRFPDRATETETAQVDHPEPGDDLGDALNGADPDASLDQVLRRAAEARDAERDQDD